MPIYMDRHDIPDQITAEDIAKMHQADLKIEHKFNCRGLTYWYDEQRKTAFCLIEAPDKESVHNMHAHAHGEVPHTIIEVEESIVASFLGRINDPVKAKNVKLNIINEPAFRIILVVEIKEIVLNDVPPILLNTLIKRVKDKTVKAIENFNGSIVQQKSVYFLTSFESVTNAILCAQQIQAKSIEIINNSTNSVVKVNIGLNAGVPVTEKENIFEDTIKLAKRLCEEVRGEISITKEVMELYESENINMTIDKNKIYILDPLDEKFLTYLMDFTDNNWVSSDLKVDDFCAHLGYSKSQLYRKMTAITGKSPNAFIKEYRLNKAFKLLKNKTDNISEIAFKSGFNSPAYFSKCFAEIYGILPSVYIKQLIVSN